MAKVGMWLASVNHHLAMYYRWCGTAGCLPVAAEARNVRLRRDEVIRLTKLSGFTLIEVRRGTIWLTGTPTNGDVLLRAGDRFHLNNQWPFVLQALADTQIILWP